MQVVSGKDITLGAWGNITLIRKESGVCILYFNTPGGANILSHEVMKHFDEAVDFVRRDSETKALVFFSPKKDMFISGADIREISKLKDIEAARHLVDYGNELFGRIVALEQPTVAAINGICLGGGLEIALCCDRRVASPGPATFFGLPEVTIGLIPGLGGTQRLPRLIGLKPALEIIVGGETVGIEQALELGLIDRAVEQEDLLDEAEKLALELIKSKVDRTKEWEKHSARIEAQDGGAEKRKSVLKITRRATQIKTKGFYPAPIKALEVIGKGLEEGLEAGMKYESEAFAQLAASTTARHLINVYFTREMAAQTAQRAIEKLGEVKNLGIIGSGLMGTAIAELALKSGIDLTVQGSTPEKSEAQVERLRKKVSDGNGTQSPQVVAALADDDFHASQVVIEAINEDVDAKNKLVFEISRAIGQDCVIASNTSSFPISHLAQMSNRPERVIGLHFFNPVERMPLVEVITHERTNADVLKRAIALIGQLGKIPVVIKDSPGFLVNRLLVSFFFEATQMAQEGVPLNWIEDAAVNFGIPIGPFALLDELGWKLTMGVGDVVHSKFGERLKPPTDVRRRMHELLDELGDNGAKFYLKDDSGKRLGFDPATVSGLQVKLATEKAPTEEDAKIRNRLFLPMVDEASRCLEEKVVRKARDVDLAMIVGAAFPAFRGGLLRYADDLGIDYVVEQLEAIYSQTDSKRTVSKMLKNMQAVGRRYYGLGSGD